MTDIRKSKSLTLAIWLAGVMFFCVGLYYRQWTLKFMEFVTFVGGFVWAGMGLFSYYWGHQKGHPVRFYSIVLFTIFSLGFFLNSIRFINGIWYIIIPLGVAGITVFINSKYKNQFWDDFRSGNKRDHFKNKIERIR
jgi:hypothetical protein